MEYAVPLYGFFLIAGLLVSVYVSGKYKIKNKLLKVFATVGTVCGFFILWGIGQYCLVTYYAHSQKTAAIVQPAEAKTQIEEVAEVRNDDADLYAIDYVLNTPFDKITSDKSKEIVKTLGKIPEIDQVVFYTMLNYRVVSNQDEAIKFMNENRYFVSHSNEVCKITNIHDGDTLTLQCPDKPKEKIRLAGIDAPEMDHVWGELSKIALEKLCSKNEAKIHRFKKDKYRRTLGVVYCQMPERDEYRNVNFAMVALGDAYVYDRKNNTDIYLKDAEKWNKVFTSTPLFWTPIIEPHDWRRMKKAEKLQSGQSASQKDFSVFKSS